MRAISFIFILFAIPVLGAEPKQPVAKEAPCAVLREFEGDVQILDETRHQLIETDLKAPVPCGAWMTVREGWAELKHRQGYVIKLAAGAFVQIYDHYRNKKWTGKEQVVLYRGKLYARVGQGSDPLRVLTANARSKIERGVMIVNYDQEEEETQIVCLENQAELANRFERAGKMKIRSGESTALNFRLLRVSPSTPKAISLASLKAQMNTLPLNKKEKAVALKASTKRRDRKFAANLKDAKAPNRSIASTRKRKPAAGDRKAHKKWKQKLVGGENKGSQALLFPGRNLSQKKKLEVVDPAAELKKEHLRNMGVEKKRVIKELSRVHAP